jgi:hypothetical protein
MNYRESTRAMQSAWFKFKRSNPNTNLSLISFAAGWNSCRNEMKEDRDKAVFIAQVALEWIDAVPQETQLPAMPGFDRDWANNTLEEISKRIK